MSQESHSTFKRLRTDDGSHITYLDVHGGSSGTPLTVQMPSAWASACAEAWLVAEGLMRDEGMRSLKRANGLDVDGVPALVHELVFEPGALVRCLPAADAIDALASDIRTFLTLATRYEQGCEGGEGLLRMIVENQMFPVGSLQMDHGFAVASACPQCIHNSCGPAKREFFIEIRGRSLLRARCGTGKWCDADNCRLTARAQTLSPPVTGVLQ